MTPREQAEALVNGFEADWPHWNCAEKAMTEIEAAILATERAAYERVAQIAERCFVDDAWGAERQHAGLEIAASIRALASSVDGKEG